VRGPLAAWHERRTQRAVARELCSLLPKLRAAFPREKFERLRQQFGAARYAGEGPLKYFDVDAYLALNAERALRLGLQRAPARRILDLGCGFGYLMFVAERLGHRALGVDFEEGNLRDAGSYAPITELLGLRRVLHRIEAFRPLPDLGGPFDLVTAYQICFALHESPKRWGVAEWHFFLLDLERQLTRDARLVFSFNWSQLHGGWLSDELRDFFSRAGAQIRAEEVRFTGLRLSIQS
jgi:SAM-dependent methyltransferase